MIKQMWQEDRQWSETDVEIDTCLDCVVYLTNIVSWLLIAGPPQLKYDVFFLPDPGGQA